MWRPEITLDIDSQVLSIFSFFKTGSCLRTWSCWPVRLKTQICLSTHLQCWDYKHTLLWRAFHIDPGDGALAFVLARRALDLVH